MDRDVTIRDVMTREYVGVSESDSVRGAAQLMDEEGSSCVVVLRGSEPVGIVTESDVLRLVADGTDPESTTVDDVMSAPVIAVGADRNLADGAGIMFRENIRNLIVEDGTAERSDAAGGEGREPVDSTDIVGVLTERDVIAATASFDPTADPNEEREHVERTARVAEANGGTAPAGNAEATATSAEAAYATQGICERCGSLADSLQEHNGQLLCPTCRGV